MEYLWSVGSISYLAFNVARKDNIEDVYVDPDDPWTVVFDAKPGRSAWVWQIAGMYEKVYAREVVEKYGSYKDWRNAVGTGPFILTDYVSGSSATLVRNPNYYGYDPFYPENQLPYFDGIKLLILPDMSTRLAALRTGKVDIELNIPAEDAQSVIRSSPQLKYVGITGTGAAQGGAGIHIRMDKPQYPFYDINVRRALAIAIDRRAMLRDLYGGQANLNQFPIGPFKVFVDSRAFVPVEELPPETRELWDYNPAKARKMLADAGYPNGFSTEIIARSLAVDQLSVVKSYWADIGVNLNINVKDDGTYTSMGTKKTHEQMYFAGAGGGGWPWSPGFYSGQGNYAGFNDPVIDAAFVESNDADVFWDSTERARIMREIITPRILNWVGTIPLPVPWEYIFWQPWLPNYHGEFDIRNADTGWEKYIWMDRDQKYEMTGRR